ncbi:MAG: PIN domain-containing protein [Verrucomicrobiota bacterium]|nr:PIN domain-containing protein [Verrucomicrobiota bacterium]
MTGNYQLLDANVLIRFLANDHPQQSPKARQLFARAAAGEAFLWLSDVCIAEVVWTLTSFYEAERKQIAEWLKTVVQNPGIELEDEELMLVALENYSRMNVDFIDAYHAAVAAARKWPIASFDRDFDKFKNISRKEPS